MATGKLTNVGQHDWFAVSLVANQAYEVTIVGGAGAEIALAAELSSDGAIALSTPAYTSPSGGTQYLYFMPSASGTYYIDVSDQGATVPENFTVSVAKTTADYTDNASDPGTVAVGGSTTGKLTNVGQHDWFAVSLVANQAYEVTIVGGAGAEIALAAELSSDGAIALSTPAYTSPSGGTQYLYFMPSASGTYYIDVSDQGATVPENFTVSVAKTTADYTDNASDPGTVTVGGSTTGKLTNVGQHDWFAVSLVANQAYEVTIVGGAGAEIALAAELSSDGAIALSTPAYTSPSGGTQYLYFMPSASGTYYIDVSDQGATVPENFTVSVAKTTADYTDNASDPGTVAVGGSTTGKLTNVGQHDWFAVSLVANQAYEVTIVGGAGAEIALAAELSSDGAIALSTPAYTSPSGGTQYLYFMPSASGTYYIDVSDQGATVPENFTVSVAKTTADYTDNASDPGTVAVGGSTTGKLTNVGQHDWFAVSLVANQAYEVTIVGGAGAEIALAAELSSDGAIALSTPAYTSPSGGTQYLYFMPSASGTYYIDVSDQGATVPENFTVSVAKTTADYTDNASDPGTVTVGGSVPPTPSVLSFAVAGDKGIAGDTFTVGGTGEAGDTATLFDGTAAIGTTPVAAAGTWSITTTNPLGIGQHSLSASEISAAEGASPTSPAHTLTVTIATPNGVSFVGIAGTNSFTGGAGNDVFKFTAADLTAGDKVGGGGGTDHLIMTTAGTINAGGVSGVGIYDLANGGANTLTLTSANFAGVAGGRIVVNGGSGGNTFNAAALAAPDLVNLIGGAGNDIFEFSAASLAAGDKVAGGGGTDRLVMTTAGTINADDVSGVGICDLAGGGANTLTLTSANFAGVTGSKITVNGGSGGNTINAAALTASDLVNLIGGAGNDIFEFSAASLAAGDKVAGGGGTDRLVMITPGTINSGDVSGVGIYDLAGGGANTLTLTTANFAGVAGGKLTVNGGSGGNTINAAALTGSSQVSLVGGAGNDLFTVGQRATMTGGGGADVFAFTTPGTLAAPDTNTITDFTHGTDKVDFSDAGFSLGLSGASSTPTALPSTLFTSNATGIFTSAAQRFAYDTSTGALFYDSKGNTAGSTSLLIGTLSGHPTLTASDLFYVT